MDTKKIEDDSLSFEKLTFEEALSLLDETVESIESGELTLLESTRLYEKGMKLAQICNDMLTSAELKVTQIQTAYGQQTRPNSDELLDSVE
jgi:exodeoxyribonuclease VII small subunit